MKYFETDVVIIGAGPVGLMCAYLGQLCGLRTITLDKTSRPLQVGRADALNARTLQLLELVGLFDKLYPLGKTCNTSSVWTNGKFVSRQSSWWDDLEGCLHKHFLMLGQSHLEQLLDSELRQAGSPVQRETEVVNVELLDEGCLTTVANGDTIRSQFVIGADGARSVVREIFKVPFEVRRPHLVWAVLDAIIETDFPKVPEIIAFQVETSDVAWIPREGSIDRFYVRMDRNSFNLEDVLQKINRAIQPHSFRITELKWYSHFSVKESLAEKFSIQERIFLAGDACHVHSVNGGQGLNTGIADAFNLMWKINMVKNYRASSNLLRTYEDERKPVAKCVIETAAELVRSTKYSEKGTHAEDYVKIVQRRATHVTGMGIRYGHEGLRGTRIFDFPLFDGQIATRLYSMLDYSKYNLLVFFPHKIKIQSPNFINVIQIQPILSKNAIWTLESPYQHQAILVRPDSYIADLLPIESIPSLFTSFKFN